MSLSRVYFAGFLLLAFAAITQAQNVRLTKDVSGGYVSAYTLATGTPYTDAVLDECSIARGRQNEPAVAVDPRNINVLIGSSNDYCGVFYVTIAGVPVALGPVWLGYYRSENGGASFQSSLVPGYPQDTSPYAALARVRTASAGDPVIAWDAHGRVFMGSESSDDPLVRRRLLVTCGLHDLIIQMEKMAAPSTMASALSEVPLCSGELLRPIC